jgi:hypothetical protein
MIQSLVAVKSEFGDSSLFPKLLLFLTTFQAPVATVRIFWLPLSGTSRASPLSHLVLPFFLFFVLKHLLNFQAAFLIPGATANIFQVLTTKN